MTTPTDTEGRSGLLRLLTAVVAVDAVLALLAEIEFRNAALLWVNLYWLVSAGGAWALSLYRLPALPGLARTIRIAFSACLGIYFLGQVVWGIQVMLDWAVVPGPSDALFLLAPLPAIWGALLIIRSRASAASLTTARLDAITMLLAFVVGILAVFGATSQGLEAPVLLLYPMFYLAPAGAFLVTVLAVAERPRPGGMWLVLMGASILAGCFIVWTARAIAGEQPVATVTDYVFGIGLLVTGFGAATSTSELATDPKQRRMLARLSELLPLVAIVTAASIAFHFNSSRGMTVLTWLALVAMLVVNGTRQILLIRSQQASQQDLRILAAELSNTEEQERRKIATYLHDHVSQAIAVLSMKAGLLRGASGRAEAAKLHDEIDDLLSTTADEIQSTTFDLSPVVLYEFGLVAAVERLVSKLNEQHSASISFFDQGPGEPIADDVAPFLYRSIRELLMNVLKHARAEKISVRIIRKEDTVIAIVEDDGCGFDVSRLTPGNGSGFGLYSIRERTEVLGGQLEIRSEPGAGTRASVIVPTLHT